MAKSAFSVTLAELFGIGRIPFAPGTFATIFAGIPVCYFMSLLTEPTGWLFLSLIFIVSCYCAEQAERLAAVQDPPEVVIDELVGFLVTTHTLPFTPWFVVAGVVLFRLFDICKPWPIRFFQETFKGGFGIVIDDVVAGAIAHLILRGITVVYLPAP